MNAPPAPLPSLEELARSPSFAVTAPAAPLADLFEQVARASNAELLAQMAFFPDLLFGAGVTCAIAVVAGVAHLLGFSPVALFVISCAVGTGYGIVRIGLGNVRFIDKRSGQDVTVAMPLALGFGYGLFAFGVEAVLSLTPVPSVALSLVLAIALLGTWFWRYRPRMLLSGRIPNLGATCTLLRLADPAAEASIAWNADGALPSDGLRYSARAVRADGARVTCATYLGARGEALLVSADFPPSYRWRYPSERMVIDGLTLDLGTDAEGVHVRTTNTHARATGGLLLKALSMTANACTPPTQPTVGQLPTYGA